MDAFWIDSTYDREYSDDGVSRYAVYVRQAAASFEPWTDNDQAVELAVWAWRQATGPVMAPGYVRKHPRIAAAHLNRSDWDGTLLATVDLVVPQPPNLRWMRSDEDRGMWRDWPREKAFLGGDRFYEPDGDELARDPYLLTTVSLRFTVPHAGLPEPGGADVDTCKQAVAIVVRELNRIVGPVMQRIEEN